MPTAASAELSGNEFIPAAPPQLVGGAVAERTQQPVPADAGEQTSPPTAETEVQKGRFSLKGMLGKVAVAAVAATIIAGGAAPEPAYANKTEAAKVSYDIADGLVRSQQRNGNFYDQIRRGGKSSYGNALGGAALIRLGLKSHNNTYVRAGRKAVNNATRKINKKRSGTLAFAQGGVAEAYIDVKNNPRLSQTGRRDLKQWGRWLGAQHSRYLIKRTGHENKYVVEANAILAMNKTGVKSKIQGAILGTRRKQLYNTAKNFVNKKVPRMINKKGEVLSDPPNNPIAYHNLSLGYYARSIQLLRSKASSSSRGTLRRLADTTELMAAPDGDTAYSGRSAGHQWNDSAAAYGLNLAAKQKNTSLTRRNSFRTLADKKIHRMALIGSGPKSEWSTPSLKLNFAEGRKSLDPYASQADYAGLRLYFANHATSTSTNRVSSASIIADRPGGRVLNQDKGIMATVTSNDRNSWGSIRGVAAGSLRSDFGFVIHQRRDANGVWRNVMPQRPSGGGTAGAGLYTARGTAKPYAKNMRYVGNGRVEATGGQRFGNDYGVRSGVKYSFEIGGNCVKTSVENPRPGDSYQYSAFFNKNATPIKGKNRQNEDTYYSPDGQIISFSGGTVASDRLAAINRVSSTGINISRQDYRLQVDGSGRPATMRQC